MRPVWLRPPDLDVARRRLDVLEFLLLNVDRHGYVRHRALRDGDATREGQRIVDVRGSDAPVLSSADRDKKIFFTDVVMKDVSATNIRRLASEGRFEGLTGLLPGPVLEYIKKYGIYRELNEAKLNS